MNLKTQPKIYIKQPKIGRTQPVDNYKIKP